MWAGVVLTAAMSLPLPRAAAQTPVYRASRTPDGKPNLNGIWQALNTANWDIQGGCGSHTGHRGHGQSSRTDRLTQRAKCQGDCRPPSIT
jgi:hypothetical protein